MNTLLLFLALPIATIILSVVLLKILKCPALVAATFFAIYLILTYAVFGYGFLIFAIVYTIISYITAIITKTICNIIARIDNCNSCSNYATGVTGKNKNCCNIVNNCCDNFANLASTENNLNTANRLSQNTNTQAQFTVTTNQTNPVLLLSNRGNTVGRQNCCCCRRK